MNEKPTNPKDLVAGSKVPLELVPDTADIAMAMAFLEGALKYGRYNWRVKGVSASVYVGALKRHLNAWWNGEDIDPASGLPHPYKMLACIAIIVDAMVCGKLTDDRPPMAPVGKMMEGLEAAIASLREQHKDKKPKQYTIQDKE